MTAIDPADAEDLHCPVCDYSLRALPEPRCPECGYAFEWAELAEQARQKKLWFYEHAGTFKSHWITRWKSLRLFPFWREIHAYSTFNSHRLMRYLAASGFLTLVVAVFAPIVVRGVALVWYATEAYITWPGPRVLRASSFRPMPPKPDLLFFLGQIFKALRDQSIAWLRDLFELNRSTWIYDAAVITTVLLVVVGGPLYWKVLGRSMRLAGAKSFHLARINVYVSDVLPVTVFMFAILIDLQFKSPTRYSSFRSFYGPWHGVGTFQAWLQFILVTPAILFLPIAVRYGWALRKYLRFPHAAAVATGYWAIATLGWAVLMNMLPQ